MQLFFAGMYFTNLHVKESDILKERVTMQYIQLFSWGFKVMLWFLSI